MVAEICDRASGSYRYVPPAYLLCCKVGSLLSAVMWDSVSESDTL